MKAKWTGQYIGATDLKDNRRPGPPKHSSIPKGSIGNPPVGLPRNLTFTRKHALQKLMVRFVAAGEGGTTGTQNLKAFIYTPSNRLRVAIYVAFEADNQSSIDPAFITQPTWSIQAMSRNPESGREVALQLAYPSSGTKNLPDAYEADTALQLLRPNITIADTAFSITYVPVGARASLVLIATWEPNVNFQGSEAELEVLYNQCSIQFGQPVLLTNNAT